MTLKEAQKIIKRRVRTLYVKPISAQEIQTQWGLGCFIGKGWWNSKLFARCNPSGKINWTTTLIYKENELKGRKIKIIARDNTISLIKTSSRYEEIRKQIFTGLSSAYCQLYTEEFNSLCNDIIATIKNYPHNR